MTNEPIPEEKPRPRIRIWQWAGLVVVFLCVLLPLSLVPVLNLAREKAHRRSCASSLKSLGLALRMYSSDWNEHFPPLDGAAGLEVLRAQGYCENYMMYLCPSTTTTGKEGVALTEETVDYRYFGDYQESDSDDVSRILICDKEGNHSDYGNALFGDGSVLCFYGERLEVYTFNKFASERGEEGMLLTTDVPGKHWPEVLAEAMAKHQEVVAPRRKKISREDAKDAKDR